MAGEDNNDEVIVSLPADTSAVTVVKVADADAVKKVEGPNDDPVIDLKNQFTAMTQRATEAERTANAATRANAEITQRLHSVESQMVHSQLDTVVSGIAAAQAEATSAEQAYVAAHEAGDGPAMARAQRSMSGAEARLQRLQEAKADIEDGIRQRPKDRAETRDAPPQRRQSADPVERFTAEMSPRSAAWIRAHPEFVTDAKKNARMLGAHNMAMADDVEVDSDEYFRRIEEGVGLTKADAKSTGDGRRPSSAAAPAAGSGGTLNGNVEVRLTKGEAASATDGTLVWNYDDPTKQNRWKKGDPIGLAEMARRKHEGKKAGLYDKNAMEA
jgi:hypothetical protein